MLPLDRDDYDFNRDRTPCRICDSPFLAYVRHIPLRRLPVRVPLFYCMDCGSFLHPQVYREDDATLRRDADWHVSVEDRNRRWAENFFAAAQYKARVKSVLEIGCGTGTLLSVAAARGLDVKGYDTNPYVGALAKQRHGIDIASELWRSDSLDRRYDLVVCISTLEHLPNPQALLAEFAAYARRHDSSVYISVPFQVERDAWHYIMEEVPSAHDNPFYFADVHLNHFSRRGFETMCRKHGATEIEFFPRGWIGYWLKFGDPAERQSFLRDPSASGDASAGLRTRLGNWLNRTKRARAGQHDGRVTPVGAGKRPPRARSARGSEAADDRS